VTAAGADSGAAAGDDAGEDDVMAQLGWDGGWVETFATVAGAPARVVRVDRGWLRVADGDGEVSVAQAHDAPAVVTGDWIGCETVDGQPRVADIAPRRTALVRRDPAEHAPRPQVLAANADQVWILHAIDQPLRAGWLDRALVLAHGSGAHPVVVVAKHDLDPDDDTATRVGALAPGAPIVTTSSAAGEGIDQLRARLADGHCAALLGRSGAGKSSLINALSGTLAHRTARVRARDARGRHTTTRRSLVRVAGGSVIDTPGIRAIGLWEPERGLAGAFPDVAELAASCRFADCSHRHEPDCGVLAGLETGALEPQRYQRYIALSEPALT
jgi:ribosome biogenesis GTPase